MSILNPKQTHVMWYTLIYICKRKNKNKTDLQTSGLNNNKTTHIHQEININQGHFNYRSKHPHHLTRQKPDETQAHKWETDCHKKVIFSTVLPR